MGIEEKFLKKAPFFAKDLLFSLWGIKALKDRYGRFYKNYVDFFRRSQFWEEEDFFQYQNETLKRLFGEAYNYSEYYKQLFDKLQLSKHIFREKNSLSILKEIPILEKNILKTNLKKIINSNRKTFTYSQTSGTTGTPLKVPFDKESWQMGFAVMRRFYDWIGLPERFKSVRLSGRIFIDETNHRNKFWVYNLITKQLFMSTYHLREENLEYYIDKLNSFKPELIEGYPSAIFVIAKYILEKNIQLDFTPIGITTTAETLEDSQREIIEKAFKAKVYNQYASSEGAPVITECKYGNLHLNLDTGIFEFFSIDSDKKANPGEMAKLIVTSFRNWKTPLIRYNIGDIVYLPISNKKCPCGVNMPYVEKIIGRQDDLVYTKEKGYIGMVNYRIFKHFPYIPIEKSQIIQESIDSFVLKIVPGENYSTTYEKDILNKAKEVLGNVKIKIEYVDDIPLYKRGKFKAVIRNFKIGEK